MKGRPSSYSPEMAGAICERIAEGRSLRSVCTDEDMPAQRTIFQWLARHEDFAQQYARAREVQIEVLADEILDIADDGARDDLGDGKVDYDHIQRSKLRVDSRKWLLSKLAPKKYGDRLDMNHSGGISVTLADTDAAL